MDVASNEIVGSAALQDTGFPTVDAPVASTRHLPAAAVAAALVEPVRNSAGDGLMFVARSESQAEEVAVSFKCLIPEAEVIVLPPWDCLPYDRILPSRESMGRRVAALVAMGEPITAPARLVVLSPEASLQRVLPVHEMAHAFTAIASGDALDLDSLRDRLVACGYLMDDRVDEPGEFALLGQGLDVFPPGAAQAYRVLVENGVAASIRSYDPVTQRTRDSVDAITLAPSTELPGGSSAGDGDVSAQGMEARLLAAGPALGSVFDVMPGAGIVVDANADDRFDIAIALIREARQARERLNGRKPTPDRFYLDRHALNPKLKGRRVEIAVQGMSSVPKFVIEPEPLKAAAQFIDERVERGFRVVITGSAFERDRLQKALRRRLGREIAMSESWARALAGEPASVVGLDADIEQGFVDDRAKLAVVSAPDVYGSRLSAPTQDRKTLAGEAELRIGDVVLHEDHGIGVLRALETVEVGGSATDVVRLEYHGGATLLAPVSEFGRIWRYGGDEETATLDRLKGDGWAKRRAQLDVEIAEAAEHLVDLARERAKKKARLLKAPRAAYARFSSRFPYPETADQSAAIASVIEDLSCGSPMNRLICGDVGFGKTEVALRAAAVAALNGCQVAVVAPTTVLARQHFETFSRRFEGTDVRVALLSRVVGNAQAKEVKAGLADGSIGIVVATHAVAAKDIAFADLALLIIDEEHRFGAKLKSQLRDLAPNLHVLSMSATPIPRTLAGAMVGVQDTSLLATPPARRRPVRTKLAPFDPASVKTALIREHRRAGQSFCVVPRIEDIEATKSELAKLVPDLSLIVAHGEMDAAEMDEAIVRFADGDGDILLSTNIIENGLDVPRANTMIIWRADRFGLAQLHQLRGRVGRGRAQGSAYLLTEPGKDIAAETRARLSTLLAFDRLGAGLAISARDLDLRGAGDLVGEEQAGHMKLIGLSLYQRLLARAVEKARGNESHHSAASVDLGFSGAFPSDYVPEAVVRLNLYSHLQRFETAVEVDAFAEELEDRFGAPPPETMLLIDLARLRIAATIAGVTRLSAGPAGIALEFDEHAPQLRDLIELRGDCTRTGNRLAFAVPTKSRTERLQAARALLDFHTG